MECIFSLDNSLVASIVGFETPLLLWFPTIYPIFNWLDTRAHCEGGRTWHDGGRGCFSSLSIPIPSTSSIAVRLRIVVLFEEQKKDRQTLYVV
jgi:hypothetical protein